MRNTNLNMNIMNLRLVNTLCITEPSGTSMSYLDVS